MFLWGWLYPHSLAVSLRASFLQEAPVITTITTKPRFSLAFFLTRPQVSGATFNFSPLLHQISAQSKLSDLANKDWECRAIPQLIHCLWRFTPVLQAPSLASSGRLFAQTFSPGRWCVTGRVSWVTHTLSGHFHWFAFTGFWKALFSPALWKRTSLMVSGKGKGTSSYRGKQKRKKECSSLVMQEET